MASLKKSPSVGPMTPIYFIGFFKAMFVTLLPSKGIFGYVNVGEKSLGLHAYRHGEQVHHPSKDNICQNFSCSKIKSLTAI